MSYINALRQNLNMKKAIAASLVDASYAPSATKADVLAASKAVAAESAALQAYLRAAGDNSCQ